MKPIEPFVQKWPRVLVGAGLALFAAACVHGGWPEWTLYVGPGLMVSGVMMMAGQGK